MTNVLALPPYVEIGDTKKESLIQALDDSGIQVNSIGLELFNDPRFTVSPVRERVSIVCLTVAELGLPEGGVYGQVVGAGGVLRLFECPLELGPHLRLAFKEQSEGSVGFPSSQNAAPPGAVTVASAPLDDAESTPKGFYLRCINGSLWLRGYRSWDGHIWNPNDAFVFARAACAA